MNSETILRAISHASPEYLEEAAQEQPKMKLRPVRRMLPLIAAAAILLLATTVAATVLLGPRISIRENSATGFDLLFENHGSTDAAPEATLTTLYFPTSLPEGGHIDSVSLGDKLHINFSVGDGYIGFMQEPASGAINENHLLSFVGWNAEEATLQNCTIGDKECTVMSLPDRSEGMMYYYFWMDEQNQTLMTADFTHHFSQAEQESFVASVQPATRQEIFNAMGVAERPVWTFSALPEGWKTVSGRLFVDAWEGQQIYVSVADGKGHGIDLIQANLQPDPSYFTETDREIDGKPVHCLTNTNDDGKLIGMELWQFLADDGQTELQLQFVSQDNTPMPEEVKLTAFRSITQTTVQALDFTALDRK